MELGWLAEKHWRCLAGLRKSMPAAGRHGACLPQMLLCKTNLTSAIATKDFFDMVWHLICPVLTSTADRTATT